MKILPVEKIREADAFTIENEPIDSIDLMERAASKVYEWFMKRCRTKEVSVKIFCGIGNNGGDGLALARMLYSTNIMPQVFVVRYSDKMSTDCEMNFERLKEETDVPMYDVFSEDDFPQIYDNDIVIDAMFGSGLNRPIEGFTAELINYLNKINAIKIAIDVPSGLFASGGQQTTDNRQQTTLPEPVEGKCQRFDKLSDRQVQSPILKADYTLSFQFPKLAFMFPEYDPFVGKWEVLDINLHKDYIDNVETLNFFATDDVVRPILHKRSKFSHKGKQVIHLIVKSNDLIGKRLVVIDKRVYALSDHLDGKLTHCGNVR